MISPQLKTLLELIKSFEGGPGAKGYGQIYGGAKGVPLSTDVSKMTLRQVTDFQGKMIAGGSRSTACGGYQFIRKTLLATIKQMNLSTNEVWTPELQDKMAIFLMRSRGLDKYMSGEITAEAFANNLAKEWASLPVVTGIIGAQKFVLLPGQSYYSGDGLNKSHHDPKKVLAAIKALKTPTLVESTPPVASVEPARPPSYELPRGLWARFKSWFG